jgi:hypothetical protein
MFLTSGCLFKIVIKVTIGQQKICENVMLNKTVILLNCFIALNLKSSHFETCEWVFWAPETTENASRGIWKAT